MNYKVLKDVKVFFASTNSSVLQRFFPRQKVGW
jgi:hypothetical protein